jgi:hypothetical protein
MQPAVRSYYALEELWGGKKVNVKLAAKPAIPRVSATRKSAHKSVRKSPARVAARED